jgi:hypothetical protein
MRKLKAIFLAVALLAALVPAAQAQAQKTHVVDYLRDASGNPLTGKVTFILTQKSATAPDGLVVASPTVSAVLDSAGKFDVWLYPSISMSPVSYYQVYTTAGGGQQTFHGVYNIPASGSVVTLTPYKVFDANLAAQYTFAPQSAIVALSEHVSAATLATMTFANVVNALGYTPANAAALGTMAQQNASSVNVTGGTLSGVTCVGCTNLGTPASAGTTATGDVVIGAATGGGPGKVRLQTNGVDRVTVDENGVFTGGLTGNTYVASTRGAKLDSSLSSGGGTDDTAKLQAVLNLAAAGKPVRLVVDGPALVGTLFVYGKTEIDCTQGGGLYLKNGANGPVMRNAHPSSGVVTDADITVRGCYVNGNKANQTGVGTNSNREASGTLLDALQFFGVQRLKLLDLTVANPKVDAFGIGNATDVQVRNFTLEADSGGVGAGGSLAGMLLFGPAKLVSIQGWVVNGSADDNIDLSTDTDAWVEGAFTGAGPYVGHGAITDVDIGGVLARNSSTALRFFQPSAGSSRIDRVSLHDVAGTFNGQFFINDPAGTGGNGNVGTVTISRAAIQPLCPVLYAGSLTGGLFALFQNFERLSLDRIRIVSPCDARPVVRVDSTANMQSLELNGLTIDDTDAAAAGLQPIQIAGYVRNFSYDGLSWRRAESLAQGGDFIKFTAQTAGVNNLFGTHSYSNRVTNFINQDAGALDNVQIENHRQSDSGGTTLRLASGNADDYVLSNWRGTNASRLTVAGGGLWHSGGDAYPDTAAPTYSSAAAYPGTPLVSVLFSEGVNTSDYASGVMIKKNGVAQTISAAYRIPNGPNTNVWYVLSSAVSGGDTVTWEYASPSGTIADYAGNALGNVSAQAVTLGTSGRAFDRFQGADGSALNGRTPVPGGASAAPWATIAGAGAQQTILNNQAQLDGTGTAQVVTQDAGAADGTLVLAGRMTRQTSGWALTASFRAVDANNRWQVAVFQNTTTLYKIQSGVATTVANSNVAHLPNKPYVITCSLSGSNINCSVNGAETSLAATDGFNATATKHGFGAVGGVGLFSGYLFFQ